MATGIARRHHYVPQFYLRGFCDSKGKLFVVDAKERKTFSASPENVAAQKDFNRVDIEGVPPDVVEKAYAKFEGEAAPALARIIAMEKFENEDDRALIFNLMALLMVRNPTKRDTIERFQHDLFKMMLEMSLATPERWESQVQQMKKAGYLNEEPAVGYDDLKEFVRKGDYKVALRRESNIKMELGLIDDVLPFFFMRKWTLFRATPKSGKFITSDHPVSLMWSKAEDRKGFYPPGLAMSNTDIIFPLSSNLCLTGAFEGDEHNLQADFFAVAGINARVIGMANRQVYGCNGEFSYMRPWPQEIGRGNTLLEDPNLRRLNEDE